MVKIIIFVKKSIVLSSTNGERKSGNALFLHRQNCDSLAVVTVAFTVKIIIIFLKAKY